MILQELTNKNVRGIIRGFLPLNKPKNIDCRKILHGLQNDLYFTLGHLGINCGFIPISLSRHLEPFASGLITYLIGQKEVAKRNLTLASYKYSATIEFGIEREFHTIDGNVISVDLDISHVNEESIKNVLSDVNGSISLSKTITYDKSLDRIHQPSENFSLSENIYRLVHSPEVYRKTRPQKYPPTLHSVESTCKVNLVEYCKPFATFDIECNGSFPVRSFVQELTARLDSRGSLVELIRKKEGPMNLNDLRVFQIHETNLESYIHRLGGLEELYDADLSNLSNYFKNAKSNISRNII